MIRTSPKPRWEHHQRINRSKKDHLLVSGNKLDLVCPGHGISQESLVGRRQDLADLLGRLGGQELLSNLAGHGMAFKRSEDNKQVE